MKPKIQLRREANERAIARSKLSTEQKLNNAIIRWKSESVSPEETREINRLRHQLMEEQTKPKPEARKR